MQSTELFVLYRCYGRLRQQNRMRSTPHNCVNLDIAIRRVQESRKTHRCPSPSHCLYSYNIEVKEKKLSRNISRAHTHTPAISNDKMQC